MGPFDVIGRRLWCPIVNIVCCRWHGEEPRRNPKKRVLFGFDETRKPCVDVLRFLDKSAVQIKQSNGVPVWTTTGRDWNRILHRWYFGRNRPKAISFNHFPGPSLPFPKLPF